MQKLWQKNWQLNQTIENFETSEDLLLDQKLVTADVMGSMAHAIGLYKIGILNQIEISHLIKGLKQILVLNSKHSFNLQAGDEDIHSKIENYLVDNFGDVGKKIHTGRSRNDQVLTATRLYSKEQLIQIWDQALLLLEVLIKFSNQNQQTLIAGYTHMQKAMPSTLGMWSAAIAESLLDSLTLLKTAFQINDQSPLGSAAGYGVPLELDRTLTTAMLGFKKTQVNSLYCQNSRGKIEAIILSALITILQDLNKLASDILIFSTSEFGFFNVANELCTGSSIMPQKKNLDLAELLRSKVHLVMGNYTQIVSLTSNLMSGYNRDFQDTKKPLFESFEITLKSLKVARLLIQGLNINHTAIAKSLSPEIFATHFSLGLVKKGVPFRDAYKNVGQNLAQINFVPVNVFNQPAHLGGISNLSLEVIDQQFSIQKKLFNKEITYFINHQKQLLKGAEKYEK